jgi:hypothetical protein
VVALVQHAPHLAQHFRRMLRHLQHVDQQHPVDGGRRQRQKGLSLGRKISSTFDNSD